MTPQLLRLAAANWRAIHETLHGPLDAQTAETVNEALSFLITVAQTDESDLRQGEPFQADLVHDDAYID